MSLAPLTPRVRRRLLVAGWSLITMAAISAANLAWGKGARAAGWPTLNLPAILLPITNATPQPAPSLPDKPIDFGTPPPTVSPTPYVAPTPEPVQSYASSGGPITTALTGSATLGGRLNTSTLAGSQSSSTTAAGFLATIARRTPKTAIRLIVPTNFDRTHTSFGEMQAGFDATHFSFAYQSQSFAPLGQLPLGATLRGPGFTFPTRSGDALFFSGTAIADDNRGFNTATARLRLLLPRGFAGLGAFEARAQDGHGRISGLSAGYATVPGRIDGTFEGVLEHTSDLDTIRSGTAFAYQARADYGNSSNYATVVARDLPNGFAPLATLSSSSDSMQSFTYRALPGAVSINLETSRERLGDQVNGDQNAHRTSLELSAPLGRRVSTTLFLDDATLRSPLQDLWNGDANFGAGWALPALSLQGTLQLGRSTQSTGTPASTVGYSLGAAKFIGKNSYALDYSATRQEISGSIDRTSTLRLGSARQRDRSSIGITATITRNQAGASDQTVYAGIAEITRRLSPSLTLTLDSGLQYTRDHLNPGASGTSGQFSLNLGTPFSLGNGTLSGRVDPRLPATIYGVVVNDAANFAGANSALSAGLGGITILLDGRGAQRTDAQGRFEFRFVHPGRHEISLDPASLPRGTTADQPFVNVNLQGGQVQQLTLGVGAFGDVEGRVYGRDRSGAIFPVPDISLRVDDVQEVQTSIAGYYGVGHLSPGSHVIQIRAQSFPASIGLVGESKRTVIVHAGERVILDFRGEPLGSIAGRVISDGNGGAPAGSGLANVYVVANPGDRAAITSDDGSYSLQNLPPGSYTLEVDEETLQVADTGTVAGPAQPIVLHVNEDLDGIVFKIGHKERAIDFTFAKTEVLGSIRLAHDTLPPGGATALTISGVGAERSPAVSALGHDVPLLFDKKAGVWRGIVRVPVSSRSMDATIVATSAGSTLQTKLHVDPSLSIASFTLTPSRPVRGQYVHVQARFLTEIAPGDHILWSDGSRSDLLKIRGNSAIFDVKLGEVPFAGTLVTAHTRAPLLIAR